MDLQLIVDELRASGGDTSNVEVKAAAGGLPSTVDRSLSALANLPGGGLVVLGLDERTGFRPVPIDAQALKQGLASVARDCAPPVVVDIADARVDGEPVVIGKVRECAPSAKPCRTSSGKAYLRAHDGDYELSALEEQAFLARREAPHFDRRLVPGTSTADLDSELVELWIKAYASVRLAMAWRASVIPTCSCTAAWSTRPANSLSLGCFRSASTHSAGSRSMW